MSGGGVMTTAHMPSRTQPISIGGKASHKPHHGIATDVDGFMVSFEATENDDDGDITMDGQRLSDSFGGMSFTDSLRLSGGSDSQWDAAFLGDDGQPILDLLAGRDSMTGRDSMSGRDSLTRDIPSGNNLAHPRASDTEYAAHLQQQQIQMHHQQQQWMQQQEHHRLMQQQTQAQHQQNNQRQMLVQQQQQNKTRQNKKQRKPISLQQRQKNMAQQNKGRPTISHTPTAASSNSDMSFDAMAAHVAGEFEFPAWDVKALSARIIPTSQQQPPILQPSSPYLATLQRQLLQQKQPQHQQKQQKRKKQKQKQQQQQQKQQQQQQPNRSQNRSPVKELPPVEVRRLRPAVVPTTAPAVVQQQILPPPIKQARKEACGDRADSPAPLKRPKVNGAVINATTPTSPKNGSKGTLAKNEAKSFWYACCGWGGRGSEQPNMKRTPSVLEVSSLTQALKNDFKEGKKQ